MAPKITMAFDLYGTLLSTASITTDLAAHFGNEKADLIAIKWRQYQLEYTWRLPAMASPDVTYIPFHKITRAALIHAVNEAGLFISAAKADDLMHSYDNLTSFDDVLPGLKTLQDKTAAGAVDALVFSNGTEAMLGASVAASPVLKLFHSDAAKPLFRKLVSVDAVRRYKPHRDVYERLQHEASADYKEQAAVWLVSANPFDVVGARAAGLRAAWVDRAGSGWVDQLGEVFSEAAGGKLDLKPTIVVKGVGEAVDKILKVGI